MADILQMTVITKADGNPFDNTGQILAMPTQDRSLANIYLVQNGSNIDRYFFKDGLADANLEVWETAGGEDGFQAYIAIVNQNTNNNPAATVINSEASNYLGDIVWSRDDVGIYSGLKAGAFTENKTIIFQNGGIGAGIIKAYRLSADTIEIDQLALDGTEAPVDSFNNLCIEIRVYP